MSIEKIPVDPTKVIEVKEETEEEIEKELRAMEKEALLQRLRFEETDPKVIKLIKKILKDK